MTNEKAARYDQLIQAVFDNNYSAGSTSIEFERTEIEAACAALMIEIPKNIGDVIYTFRYRRPLPKSIRDRAADGKEWAIMPNGRAKYRFQETVATRILPTQGLVVTKIPDATPEIVLANILGDEQAVLARIRYNRLIDLFLGVSAYSLQNHLRTTVVDLGQVEVDELYAAVNDHGVQYVVPVQAKGGNDQIGIVQIQQDLAMCSEKFPTLIPRAVAAQSVGDVLVLFELTLENAEIRIVRERQYRLVAADEITQDDLDQYASRSNDG